MKYKLPFYRSLRFRLSLMIAAVICTIMSATAVLSAKENFERAVTQKRELLSAAASGHSAAVAVPVMLGSRRDALASLRGIRDLPSIVQSDIRLNDGRVFAQLGTGATLIRNGEADNSLQTADLWNMRQLRIEIPILNNGEQIGRLGMLADLSDLRAAVFKELRKTILTAFLAILLGVVLAHRMISSMTRPLHKLSAYMADFADERAGDYEEISGGRDETGILASAFRDMLSSIKERDKKIAHHMETLEDTIKERTKDLKAAKDAAEAANAAKSDFLATMSHEIRTPMNGMLVMAEMLSAADLSTRHRRYAEIIARSGNSLLAIINDILDMSKIESGKLELEACEVSVDTLISDVTTLFWERAREQNVELTSYVSPTVPTKIVADPVRLNQIITNLVNNALKFTETGSVQIRVDAEYAKGETCANIIIEVEDTGIGIPADKVETIFDAFSQADQSTTRRFGGTGLGLAVCRRLTDAMGGKISVTSKPGKGSIFRLELEAPIAAAPPVFEEHTLTVSLDIPANATANTLKSFLEAHGSYSSESDADITITTSNALSSSSADPTKPRIILSDIGDILAAEKLRSGQAVDVLSNPFTRQDIGELLKRAATNSYRRLTALDSKDKLVALPTFGNMRVLAADDNAVNREILREALSALNVSVDFAENGLQVVEMARETSYDAIFMDGSMPKMDGFEATRTIREHELAIQTPPTPVIALTAQIAGTTQQTWREAGAEHYISKPFTLQRLAAILAKLGQGATPETTKTDAHDEVIQIPLLNMETINGLDELGNSSGSNLRGRVWGLFRLKAPEGINTLIALAEEASSRTEIAKQAHALKSMALSSGMERLASTCSQIEAATKQDIPWQDIGNLIRNAKTDLDQSFAVMAEIESTDADGSNEVLNNWG